MSEYFWTLGLAVALAKQYGKQTENESRMFTFYLYFLVTDTDVVLLLTVAAD